MAEVKLFNKWSSADVKVNDLSVMDYIAVAQRPVYTAHSAGRYQRAAFRKAQCPIVERLVCALMFHGRNTGKKLKAVNIVKQAFEIIALVTKGNPLQVLADAVAKGGPREDSVRIGAGGAVRRQACDVAPLRRVNQALYLIAAGARNSSFRNLKSIAECLADEIINASLENMNSYTIKKRDEIERVSKAAR
jgi:small subunit ribosomal protein S5e